MTAQILVVDDEPDMKALVLQKFRRQIGGGAINFLFASDGIEALAMLDSEVDGFGDEIKRAATITYCG